MKRFIEVLTIALLAAGLVACESLKLGDAGLSRAPETSGATLDTLFASLKDADKVLAQAYYYLPYGLVTSLDNKMGSDFLESITDHYISNKHTEGDGPNDLYYNGGLGANMSGHAVGSETYRFGSETDYSAIRYAWLFLENADRIPGADPVLLAQKKAEAKMVMAIAYANMVRYVGGVPILDHAVRTDEEMNYPRNTFAQTIDYIVKLCDEAAPDLPWSVSAADDGRLTRAAALGIKLRILCYAASPTLNSDKLWHPQANEYTCYTNYSADRWQKAKAAADEFMREQLSNGYYALVQATPDNTGAISPRAYRLAYRKGYFERGTTETIISVRKSNSGSFHDKHIDVTDDFGCGASLDWVNKFSWADGTPFPEDFPWETKADWPEYPFFRPDPNGTLKVGSETFTETRDPRLYENIAVPGDIWNNGTVGPAYDNSYGHGDGCPGFLEMKYILQQSGDRSLPPHWCLMRFAEVLLNAAEAYNEADGGPSDKAYTWVNAVRARVGLPGLPEGLTQEEFREALLLERELEFGFEEVRWFDMVRWGLTKAFTTPLRGLTSIGNKQKEATSFTFKEKEAYPPRKWYTDWDTKWYFAPIPAVEINKNYGMTQNPGW
ncbi:MAG: RagB/SusD family nutrient uptake outer membrane protein [Bacteroidales bacterium]|nr:RagB/SusD family nutrient uptake outer membrane protein [Bacteroidales bacterium]